MAGTVESARSLLTTCTCVGPSSYPGEMIAENRNVEYQKKCAGQPCATLKEPPPCIYSINAFGREAITAYADPPDFFKGGAKRETWRMPASTIAVWPYEVMYGEDVKQGKGFDYNKRRQNAEQVPRSVRKRSKFGVLLRQLQQSPEPRGRTTIRNRRSRATESNCRPPRVFRRDG